MQKVPIGGGSTTTLVDAAYLQDFTVDGSNVYFSELASNPGSIKRTPVGGGAAATVATNALAWVLTNDSTNMYWIDPRLSNGGIGIVPKSQGGGPAPFPILGTIATDPLLVAEAITVADNNLYWTESDSGAIYAIR